MFNNHCKNNVNNLTSSDSFFHCSKTTNLSQLWYTYVKQTTHPLTHAVLNSYLQFIIILFFLTKIIISHKFIKIRLQTATNNDVKFNTTTFVKKRLKKILKNYKKTFKKHKTNNNNNTTPTSFLPTHS